VRAEQVTGVPARRIGIGLIAAVALLTSSCAAGQKAQTADVNESIDGTSVHLGSITIGGLAIQSPKAAYYPTGSDVPVRVVIVNSGTKSDTLTSITSSSIAGWTTTGGAATSASSASKAASVTIAGGARASFGVPDSKAVLQLTQIKSDLHPGSAVPLTFTFANAGSVTVRVPVQLSSSPQTAVLPGPSATGEQG
jgi:periplasmic copper chaperone A